MEGFDQKNRNFFAEQTETSVCFRVIVQEGDSRTQLRPSLLFSQPLLHSHFQVFSFKGRGNRVDNCVQLVLGLYRASDGPLDSTMSSRSERLRFAGRADSY